VTARSTSAAVAAPEHARGANVVGGDIALPAMVLKERCLENNLTIMSKYAADHGFLLAPHGKTTMAPKLFRRQLDAGAWAMTVASVSQAIVAYGAGAERVLVANEIVGRADARAVVEALATGGRELYCLVDSTRGVALLDRNFDLGAMSGRLGVLVELGAPGRRTGARTEDEAVAVAGAVAASAHLRLVGVEGFEGVIAGDRSAEALADVDRYLEAMRHLAVRLADEGAFSGPGPVLISAGGSKYFDRVADVLGRRADYGGLDVRLVVRSGCYAVHDHGIYAESSPLAGPWRGPPFSGQESAGPGPLPAVVSAQAKASGQGRTRTTTRPSIPSSTSTPLIITTYPSLTSPSHQSLSVSSPFRTTPGSFTRGPIHPSLTTHPAHRFTAASLLRVFKPWPSEQPRTNLIRLRSNRGHRHHRPSTPASGYGRPRDPGFPDGSQGMATTKKHWI